MLNSKQGSLMALVVIVGSIFAGTAAFAEGTLPVGGGTSTSPTPKKEDIRGRCRFEGVFADSGKTGMNFAVHCEARLLFDKDDLRTRRNENERDRLEVECDGQRLYSDGLRVFVRTDDNGHDRSERDLDVIFSGHGGAGTPRIFVDDLKIRDRSSEDHERSNRSRLTFWRSGFSYELPGRCEFEKDDNHSDGGEL